MTQHQQDFAALAQAHLYVARQYFTALLTYGAFTPEELAALIAARKDTEHAAANCADALDPDRKAHERPNTPTPFPPVIPEEAKS